MSLSAIPTTPGADFGAFAGQLHEQLAADEWRAQPPQRSRRRRQIQRSNRASDAEFQRGPDGSHIAETRGIAWG